MDETVQYMRQHLQRSTNHFGSLDSLQGVTDEIESILSMNPPEFMPDDEWNKWYLDGGAKKKQRHDADELPDGAEVSNSAIAPASRAGGSARHSSGSSGSSGMVMTPTPTSTSTAVLLDDARVSLPRRCVAHLCECAEKAAAASRRSAEISRSAADAFDAQTASFEAIHKALFTALQEAAKSTR
jgi:hypothetical protein